ncbi:hypothetical protein ACIBG7_38505 [Nonomuraea sp. NPDC050328]|uniref:hypothetical protein n=1 Tax=Nonomuraea sp. NPDC050328 TaxID=3364361 RepID=UPI0037A0D22D
MMTFAELTGARWAGFRRSRGLVAGLAVAMLIPLALGLLFAAGSRSSCTQGAVVDGPCPPPPLGPGGEAVEDRFFFVHRSLDGDGTITARVGPMTGRIKEPPPPGDPVGPPPVPGVAPWSQAGLMIKSEVRQGAPYVAVLTAHGHGVRMQYDFTGDLAGSAAQGPRWLRLTRAGKTITGYESGDGRRWSEIGRARLAGPARIGLFAASPGALTVEGLGAAQRFSEATATFDRIGVTGASSGWRQDDVGVVFEQDGVTPHHPGGLVRSGDTMTLTGVGAIGPVTAGVRLEHLLTGLPLGLLALVVVGSLLGASRTRPGEEEAGGRVVAAKAVVAAGAGFAGGLVVAAVALLAGEPILRAGGNHPLPVSPLTEVRVIVGVAVFWAVVAALAVGVAALVRRRVVAIGVTALLVVAPALAAVAVPGGVAGWLHALTPAAGYAVTQTIPAYPQVAGHYVPATGFYPLPFWAGLAVACGYAVLALLLAVRRAERATAVPA